MSEDRGIAANEYGDSPTPLRPTISRTRKLTFATLIVLAFLGVLEVIGRVFVPIDGNARWNYESNHIRLTGFPALNDILESDAKRFWKLKPNVPTRHIIGRVGEDNLIFSFSTDGDGFRKMPAPRFPRQTILFIGDSCTLGIGVDDDATIPAVVQDRLPGLRCINAGVPGYSAYQGRVYLESIIGDLKPNVVVMCFGFNDNAAWDDKSDVEHAAAIVATPEWRHQLGLTRLIGVLATPAPIATSQAAGLRPRLTDAEFSNQVESLVATCIANGARPILLIWPLREQMTRPGMTGKQTALLGIGALKGSTVLNLVDAARAHHRAVALADEQPVAPLFADLLHFNEKGCKMAGRLIADLIEPSPAHQRVPDG